MSKLRVEALEQPDGTAFIFNNKNLLINGSQSVWQRSISKASITTSGYHTADRWRTSINALGTWTQSRSTDVPSAQGFGYSLKLDCTTADASPAASDYHSIGQRVEAQNIQHLLYGTSNAKSLTFSCWVKSNKTGVYTVEFYKYGTSTQRHIAKEITIDTANTWEKKTVTIPGDVTEGVNNNNGLSLEVQIWLGAGSNFTSGTFNDSAWATVTNANRISSNQVNLADSTSNELYTTGWQLEVGSTASGFEFEPFEKTLIKCHRYYRKWDRTGPPAESYTQAVYVGIGQFFSGTTAIVFPNLTTTMRTAPDAAYSNATHFRIGDNAGGNNDTTAVSVHTDVAHTDDEIAGTPVFLWTSSTNSTLGRIGRAFITDSSTGFIAMDAEL